MNDIELETRLREQLPASPTSPSARASREPPARARSVRPANPTHRRRWKIVAAGGRGRGGLAVGVS